MPLWLDLLRTPMAARETRRLRRMRLGWQILCLFTAVAVSLIAPLRALLGQAAPCIAAALIALTLIQSVIYWVAKQRADSATLDLREKSE